MDEHTARMVSDIEYIKGDIGDIKSSAQNFAAEMKAEIRRLDNKIDGVNDKLSALAVSMERTRRYSS